MNAATLIGSRNTVQHEQPTETRVSQKSDASVTSNSGVGIAAFDVAPDELQAIANKGQGEIAALDQALANIVNSASFPAFIEMAKKLNPFPSWIRRIPVVRPAYMVTIARDSRSVLCVGRDGLELSTDMSGMSSGAYERKPATGAVLRTYGWTPEKLESGFRAAQKMLAAALGDAKQVRTHHHGNPNRDFIR